MGLSPDVLHKLLATDPADPLTDKDVSQDESSGNEKDDEGDILEFEFESPDNSPPSLLGRRSSAPGSTDAASREAQEVILDPVADGQEAAGSSSAHHKKFRLRLLSETQPVKPVIKPMGVMDMVKMRTEPRRKSETSSRDTSPEPDVARRRRRRVVRRAAADDGAVKAEYVLVGECRCSQLFLAMV